MSARKERILLISAAWIDPCIEAVSGTGSDQLAHHKTLQAPWSGMVIFILMRPVARGYWQPRKRKKGIELTKRWLSRAPGLLKAELCWIGHFMK